MAQRVEDKSLQDEKNEKSYRAKLMLLYQEWKG